MNAGGGRAYEVFEPPHKMVPEPPTHTLSVDLSGKGYKKEHVKVQLLHSCRLLAVCGECPVHGDRWSRFRVEVAVPDGCDMKAIHARFANGVVRVTMPGLKAEPAAAGAVASPGLRGLYRFLREYWGRLATTVVGVVLVLFCFGIFIRYSVRP